MYWEEKIDLVKKKFGPDEFKDPYIDGPRIVEKIIRDFHHATLLAFNAAANKSQLMKHVTATKQYTVTELYQTELPALPGDKNFWLLLTTVPQGKPNMVYDCKKTALMHLVSLASGQEVQEFYIVDKKYTWLMFFRLEGTTTKQVRMYKSGETDF